eukprot:scaffold31664_cov90-Skeletonema_marinoi.AAC.1
MILQPTNKKKQRQQLTLRQPRSLRPLLAGLSNPPFRQSSFHINMTEPQAQRAWLPPQPPPWP